MTIHGADDPGGPSPACRLSGVSKRYRKGGDQIRALDEVSLRVAAGERLGIIGESGSGKSTIGKLVLGLIHADAGRLELFGEDCTRPPKAEVRKRLARSIGFVFQQPFDSLDPRLRLATSIGEPLRIHGPRLSRDEMRDRIEEALVSVSLPPAFASRYPGELSGGQAQRAAIARSLILEPDLLVLDEPTSSLDATTQREVLGLLCDLQRERGMAWMFITHDLRVAEAVTDAIAVMRLGTLEEYGPTRDVLAAPGSDYCKQLIQAGLPG